MRQFLALVGTRRGLCCLAVAVALLAVGGVALAQTGGPYNLEWNAIAGGGGSASGGAYSLYGVVGQAGAGVAMTGGNYSLEGGFMAGASAAGPIYVPMVQSNFGG